MNGETWSRGTDSRLPFGVNLYLNLSIINIEPSTTVKGQTICSAELLSFRWVTINDALACEDPCFFCVTCFKGLHYTPDGEKICDFQAYPFVGDFDW